MWLWTMDLSFHLCNSTVSVWEANINSEFKKMVFGGIFMLQSEENKSACIETHSSVFNHSWYPDWLSGNFSWLAVLFSPISPVWERAISFTFLQIPVCGRKLPEVHLLFHSTVVRLGGLQKGLVHKGKESHLQLPVKPTVSLFRIFNVHCGVWGVLVSVSWKTKSILCVSC